MIKTRYFEQYGIKMAPTELGDDVTNEEESDEFREMVDDGRDNRTMWDFL